MVQDGDAPRGRRAGLQDVVAELQKSRKVIAATPGQIVLRRHLNTLSQHGLRLFKQTSEQVLWQDGCFSVSAETKWDDTRCGRDIVLSNNNTTVTRSNGNEWGGVLGAQLFSQGNHSFTYYINKCQTDYVYVGVAYDNVDYNDNYNPRNIVLRAGDGSLRVFSSSQGCFGGYRSGDSIRIEVDMTEKVVTFFKNDVRLCQASGLSAPVRPFVSIGSRDVIITIKCEDRKSAIESAEPAMRSPLLDIAGPPPHRPLLPSPLTPHPSPLTPHPSPLTPHPSHLTVRTGLEFMFAMLVKRDNAIIRRRLLHSAHAALLSLEPLAFYRYRTYTLHPKP
jgi:hypothetical protein